MIRALEEWRHYIQGPKHTTIIYSDHKNLTYFQTAQKLNRQQARWSLYLSEFDLKLIHLPGSKMIQSDTLSRQPDHGIGIEQDNEDMVLLPENLFINLLEHNMTNPTRILAINNTDNEDDDPDAIKSLSIHGLKTLRNHFSNNTAAFSVNDITINVMDMDLQRRITTAQDMDIPVK